MNVTREVITDLWPVYAAGEAHADTRALVEAFLKQDPKFAQLLEEGGVERVLAAAPPGGPTNREAQALLRTKRLLHGNHWLLAMRMLALAFTGLAFARIVADTSWDVSPVHFIVTVAIAAILWVAYALASRWVRKRVYREAMGGEGPGTRASG